MSRLYSYSIRRPEYVWRYLGCLVRLGHSLKFNSGDPACSHCWTRAPRFGCGMSFMWRAWQWSNWTFMRRFS